MRWLTGWSGSTPTVPAALRPLAATPLWTGPDPLWAVGDWRPDEIRLVTLHPGRPATVTTGLDGPDPTDQDTPATSRLAVLGRCGATDAELAAGLATARGGAVRHLTGWPGSYTAVLRSGLHSTQLLTDLAGVQPVFHTPWHGGTAYATAALPLADLTGAAVDTGHLAARLACPESPEAIGTGTPYQGVHRVPPGQVLAIRSGRAQLVPYDRHEPYAPAPLGPAGRRAEAPAVRELTRALLEAVRCRVRTAPPEATGGERPRLGVDLSYGTASATVALLAAAVPIAPATAAPQGPDPAAPRPRTGAVKGSWARPGAPADPPEAAPDALAAVTLGEGLPTEAVSAEGGPADGEPGAHHALAVEAPRLRHLLLPPALPYAELSDPEQEFGAGPLTDEPGPVLVTATGTAARFDSGGADHLTGYGARHLLDGHPARLADLIRAGRSRELLAPMAALASHDGGLRTPVAALRAARRLARARYAEALDDAAVALTLRRPSGPKAALRSHIALAWCTPGPAARWLSDDALSAVALRLRLAARQPAPTEPPGARRARHALHRHAADYRTLVQATEQYGQRLHAPFLDNQVVRAAALLPDETRLQPGARHALLRAVLTGAGRTDLPPDWGRGPRPDRAAQARTGLRLAADPLAELFRAPLLAEAGLIDLPAVRTALAEAAAPGTPLPPDTLAGLADLIATELWLRRTTARRGTCWTGLPAPVRPELP
ncbi:asparagine synthase-related protein [Kitasatospora sp. NPDC002227]|uniref:asparagine synthase-related protein n=1 Tax=Kitasatospora sp. NPDC002227 TaxID=3154773 RepID=UPI00331E224D